MLIKNVLQDLTFVFIIIVYLYSVVSITKI